MVGWLHNSSWVEEKNQYSSTYQGFQLLCQKLGEGRPEE